MASRKQNGEGSITKRKDGRWMARYSVTLPDGTRKRQSITMKDRVAVLTRLQEEIAQANRGMPVNKTKYPLRDWVEYWLENIDKDKVKESTWDKHRYQLERLVLPEIGHISVQALTPVHIKTMLNSWARRGVGSRSSQLALFALSAAMRDAVKHELVYRNVVRLVDKPKHQTRERNFWTQEQARIFLNSLQTQNHRFYSIFLVMFTYGMRPGEAVALQWDDVDFSNNLLSISKTMVRIQGQREYKLTTPKTQASYRKLPLTPAVRATLLAEAERRNPQPSDFLFITKTGNHIDYRSLATMFERHAYQLGLPRLTLQEIRHTLATMLKDNGVSPKDAQTILGHSSITTTLQIYTHSTLEKKSEALASVSTSLGVSTALS